LFVGAGLSQPSGFVNWKELMRDIASELGLDVDREGDLIALAQYHVNEKGGGRARLNQLLIEEFLKDAKTTENHRLIATLPIRSIWTTNYDCLLESAFRESQKRPDIKTTSQNLAQSAPSRDVVIYKMHGDISQPHDAVLTKEDYETYSDKRELFSTLLKGELVSKTFLFLGFSFTDPNIDYILGRIRGLLGQNQREHYCVMKWPERPRGGGGDLASHEYDRRKLELRISDLSRYSIQAVMIDDFGEITQLLAELNKGSHLNEVFVSGSAHEWGAFGQERMEALARALGGEIVQKGLNLVSGFGLGIGGAVVIGALEAIYANGLSQERLHLFSFPQKLPDTMDRFEFYRRFRKNMIANVGFSIFICGNRYDAEKKAVISAPGVLEEFDITRDLERYVIPIGATGFAAAEIWQLVSNTQEVYYPGRDVREPLRVLGATSSTDEQLIAAVFDMINTLSK
jgi:Sir2- and TIR-associating SLOG family/SIR2-like domain